MKDKSNIQYDWGVFGVWILIIIWIILFNAVLIIGAYCVTHFHVELWDIIQSDIKNLIHYLN
jgi:uncharacterized BrkB/YihY/UPF0761 family membrane protein